MLNTGTASGTLYASLFRIRNMEPERGYRKRIKHFHQPGDFHELTFSCYRRMPLLTNDDWQTEFSRCIDAANEKCRFELVAFVFMPEHVHLLTLPLDVEPDIGFYLASIKQPFSKFVKLRLTESQAPLLSKLTIRERPGKYCFRFWQEGAGFDRNLFKPDAIQAAIDYIHKNPVERQLCQPAVDWKWSSARYYLLDPPCQQFVDLPNIHGLRPETFHKDELR